MIGYSRTPGTIAGASTAIGATSGQQSQRHVHDHASGQQNLITDRFG
jgi:hypothetical protein